MVKYADVSITVDLSSWADGFKIFNIDVVVSPG